MTNAIRTWWKAEAGQAVSEYALLLAFAVIAVMGLAVNVTQSLTGAAGATTRHLERAGAVSQDQALILSR